MSKAATQSKTLPGDDISAAVPTGYKRTEVAVIPNDWSLPTVGAVFDALKTASNSRSDLDGTGDIAYIHYGDIHTKWNHFVDFGVVDVPRLSLAITPTASTLKDGDLIVADASEDEAGVGKSVEVKGLVDRKAISGLHTILLRARDDQTHQGYRGYLLETPSVKVQLRKVATGLKVFGISKKAIRDVLLPLPTPVEQRAIAEALSDVDELIGALEKLIAKKRAIKQATMQQLLTGNTRLPGFTDAWKNKSLGSCGSTYGGITGKSKADFGHGSARYVTFLNVLENAVIQPALFDNVDISLSESQNRVLRGDLLFNGTSETPGDLALGACVDQDYDDLYLNSFCFGFRFHKGTDHAPLFFAYFFRGPTGRQLMSALAQGATRYNMSKRQFLDLECELPEGDEQQEIATVLSDMDAEIAALDRRRDKTKQIKQGMMQQLLTGRVRLVEQKEAT